MGNVPDCVGMPESVARLVPLVAVKMTPFGRVAAPSLMVAGGVPVVVTVNVLDWPTTKFTLLALVKAGAAGLGVAGTRVTPIPESALLDAAFSAWYVYSPLAELPEVDWAEKLPRSTGPVMPLPV